MKASRRFFALILVLVVCALAAGCGGGGGSAENRTLTLGDIGWDESVAVSNLTKTLLENDVGYNNVELRPLDVALLFQGVDDGQLNAFQDVWLPNHQKFVDKANNTKLLDPWFQGQTSFGIAVPDYVNIRSIPELNNTNITEILGIEPGAVISDKVPQDVIPTYNLKQTYVPSSTAAMLSEVNTRYNRGEDFSFIAWSPHWMNQRYSFHLLDDPQDALGDLNDPARMLTIVNKDLPNNDPVAYAFMNAIRLDAAQLDDLENTINESSSPLEGARKWADANPDIVQPWIDAAKNAQGT